MQTAAGWAWRLLVLGVVAYVAFLLLARFQSVVIAVFLGLVVVTALLRPLADRMSRVMPRPLAVVCAYMLVVLLIAALLSATGLLVANEAPQVAAQFDTGIGRVERWLEGAPFHVRPGTLTGLQQKVTAFLSAHRSSLLQSAVNGATQAVEILTVGALGLFCSVFFVHLRGADVGLLPRTTTSRQARRLAARGWPRGVTSSGYIRGMILVASINAFWSASPCLVSA